MQYRRILSVALALLGSSAAYKSRSFNSIDAEDAGNPIRKVVTMMEKMGKKIEEEGKHEEDLYDKFKCYCKTASELEASIQQQEYNPEAWLKPEFRVRVPQDPGFLCYFILLYTVLSSEFEGKRSLWPLR